MYRKYILFTILLLGFSDLNAQWQKNRISLLVGGRLHSVPYPKLSHALYLTGTISCGLRWDIDKLHTSIEARRSWWLVMDYSFANSFGNNYVLTDYTKKDYVGAIYHIGEKHSIGGYHVWARDDTWTNYLWKKNIIQSDPNYWGRIPIYNGLAFRYLYLILPKWELDIEYLHYYNSLFPNVSKNLPQGLSNLSVGLHYTIKRNKK